MTSRDEWIDTQASNMLFSTCLPIAKIKQILRDAMAFADAHREGQEVLALRELLGKIDPVQYFEMADFPLECQVCEAEAHDDGKPFIHKPDCAWLLNAITTPTPPPREQGDE